MSWISRKIIAHQQYLLDAILTQPEQRVPDLLNTTFHVVDSRLSHLAQTGKTQSGCTAVTAFLRIEAMTDEEPRGFTNPDLTPRGLMDGKGEAELEAVTASRSASSSDIAGGSGVVGGVSDVPKERRSSARKFKDLLKGFTSSKDNEDDGGDETPTPKVEAIEPRSDKGLRRVLYTANVGDARAVIWYVSLAGRPTLGNDAC